MLNITYTSLSQPFPHGGTLEIAFWFQGTPAKIDYINNS